MFVRRPLFVCLALLLLAAAVPVWRAASVSPAFGDPIPGLTPAQRALFLEGRDEFQTVEDAAEGLGPVFNGTSCGGCHVAPAVGGASTLVETRFGRLLNGKFDPMTEYGGSLIQSKGIGPTGSCDYEGETVPPEATIVAGRLTTPLFGLGLVEAVPDAAFQTLALLERTFTPATAGRVHVVTDPISSHAASGRFGWKAQVSNLTVFSADAYLNEMGVTSPIFPNENCPQGDCGALLCSTTPSPEDDGTDVAKFADFMRFLGAPPRGPVDANVLAGELVFAAAGCASCHTPALQTGPSAVAALDRKIFHPYSDFLLHDMGALGDGIEQGHARGREMRTAPLWGVRTRERLLHDGRAATLDAAIAAHDGQGRFARDAFAALPPAARSRLLAFLKSL